MATLEERIAAIKSSQVPSETPSPNTVDSMVAGRVQNLNIGLANLLGAPVEMVSNLMKATGVISPEVKPFLGTEHVREFFTNIGATPEVGKEQKDFTARALRIAGETAVPFAGAQLAGAKAASVAASGLNDVQKALMAAYQRPWRAAGAETTAILGGALGGEVAHSVAPDNVSAEALGELLGGITPSALTSLGTALPTVKGVKGFFTGEGAKQRAANRVQLLAGDLDQARIRAFQATELDLDPITATGDAGLMALEKAAIEQNPKLAERVAKLSNAAMNTARNKVLAGGDAQDTIDFLKALRREAAGKAQADISKLGTNVDPVLAARSVRTSIENSLKQARATESALWSKLPNKGVTNPQRVVNTFEDIISQRSIASDPEDIPNFVFDLVGKPTKKGFMLGKVAKNPELGAMKDLKSRLQREMTVERAKDAPNRNKIRILGELENAVYDSLVDYSPEYGNAVSFSRELNKQFTRGKIGDLLGFERTGELSTSAEGTLDFLMSGNKDDVRMGLRQIAEASPETIPVIKESLKATFNAQALDPNSGALNVANARRFLSRNQHILDEFPDLLNQVKGSIKSQRAVDELVGAPVGDKLSTYMKDKSVAALYLEGTPDTAMHRLISAKNREGAGAVMRNMISMTNQDPTGRATKGLKNAFGSYLLNHAETADSTVLSGKKFLKMLTHLGDAAKSLYTKDELERLFRIGTELRKIEAREATRAVKGGVISDMPNKIIQIIGGTFAARAGAKAGAGTSGASLRTASIFTKEFNKLLQKLTVDGAEEILMKSVEDPVVLRTLLMEPTPANQQKAAKVFNSFLTGQAVSGQQGQQGESSSLPLEQRIELLKQQRSQGAIK